MSGRRGGAQGVLMGLLRGDGASDTQSNVVRRGAGQRGAQAAPGGSAICPLRAGMVGTEGPRLSPQPCASALLTLLIPNL